MVDIFIYVLPLVLLLIASIAYSVVLWKLWRKYHPVNTVQIIGNVLLYAVAVVPVFNAVVAGIMLFLLVLSIVDGSIELPDLQRKRKENRDV